MLPAHQRLDAHHALAVGGQERLIQHPQLVARERLRELALGLAALVQRLFVARIEHAQRTAAFGARAVERDVGAPQQRLGIVRVFGRDRDADRSADCKHVIAGWRRMAQAVEHVAADAADLVVLVDLDQNREFVAAEPRRGHAVLDRGEPPGRDREQFVADVMPERVVDVLEAVDVDEQERKVLSGSEARERQRERFNQLRAVAETGERIAEGESRRPALAFGELLVRAPHVTKDEKPHEPDKRGNARKRGHQPIEHLGPGPARFPREPRTQPLFRHRHLDPDLPFGRRGAFLKREIVD